MKHSDIDKEIADLTQKARELERQRETLAALDVCNAQGHDVYISHLDATFEVASILFITCKVCGCLASFTGDGAWYVADSNGNATVKVTDFYETEPTEPLPEPEPVRTAPAEQKDEPHVIRDDGTMKTLDETDTTGFYRVKFGE